MKYKYFHILFLALLISLGGITFSRAQSDSDGEINVNTDLEDSWEDISTLEMQDFQKDISDLMESRNRLDQMEQAFQKSQLALEESKNELNNGLQEIETIQAGLEETITRKIDELDRIEEEIRFLEREIDRQKIRQEEIKTYLRKILVDSYKTDMEEKHISLFGILLEKTFDAQIGKTLTLQTLENSMNQLLEKQQGIEASLNTFQQEILSRKTIKEKTLLWLESHQEELEETKITQKEILSETIKKEALQNKVAKIQTKKHLVDEKIEQKFAEYENTIEEKIRTYACNNGGTHAICRWVQGYIQAEKNLLADDNITFTQWAWPILPIGGLGYHFRDQKYFTNNTVHHEGLDILVESGKSIKTIGNGYVLFKQFPKNGSPGMVAIKHPGNFVSVYLGIAPTSLAMFSRVTVGDDIATSTDYMDHSGKNNMHLILYENGKIIDPLEKLDMSQLDPSLVPPRYGWKYIDDLKKSGTDPEIDTLQKKIGFFFIPGTNEFERQKKLLEIYASTDFKAYDPWIEESIIEGIDPTFVLCVGFAESTLGNNLTTSGNIGNVGNTDDGDRQIYADFRSGVRAISSVVNNVWLGGYITIDELSGWGNSTGPIYASSQTNWHENIIKCMSAIKGRFVGNSAKFRLTKAGLYIYKKQGYLQKDTPEESS